MSDMTAEYGVSRSAVTSKKPRFGVAGTTSAKGDDNLETAGHGRQFGQSAFARTMTRNNATPGVSMIYKANDGADAGEVGLGLEPSSATALNSRASKSASVAFRSRLGTV